MCAKEKRESMAARKTADDKEVGVEEGSGAEEDGGSVGCVMVEMNVGVGGKKEAASVDGERDEGDLRGEGSVVLLWFERSYCAYCQSVGNTMAWEKQWRKLIAIEDHISNCAWVGKKSDGEERQAKQQHDLSKTAASQQIGIKPNNDNTIILIHSNIVQIIIVQQIVEFFFVFP